MTTPELLRQYIAADLTARAEAAGIDIHDEWDFPYDPAIDEDEEEDPNYDEPNYGGRCEDAPCCGCCGTNIYGVNQEYSPYDDEY